MYEDGLMSGQQQNINEVMEKLKLMFNQSQSFSNPFSENNKNISLDTHKQNMEEKKIKNHDNKIEIPDILLMFKDIDLPMSVDSEPIYLHLLLTAIVK